MADRDVMVLAAVAALALALAGQAGRAQPVAVPERIVFEEAGLVRTTDFVPAELMSGMGYHVSPAAEADGINLTYTFVTERGREEIVGTDWLMIRIAEERAIQQLAEMNRVKEFGSAVGDSAKSKLAAAGDTIRNPLRALGNVPKGASRFFGGIGESMKGGKSKFEDRAYADVLGEAKAKRSLAFQLGVDPYSSNKALQNQMNAVAWTQAGAQLGLGMGLGAFSGVAGATFSAMKGNETFQRIITDMSPSELRGLNRKSLSALGVPEAVAEEFLRHPWYSPTRETAIVLALEAIGAEQASVFVSEANTAVDETDAFFFHRMALLLELYAEREAPLKKFVPLGHLVGALDANQRLVVPVPLDLALWTERTAARATQLAELAGGGEVAGVVVWTNGRFSRQLRDEATALGLIVRESVAQQP